jgi:formamidopyrimidine-DNA glycosylase
MPELPEVEITRRGLASHIVGQRIDTVIVRDRRLRWPITPNIEEQLAGRTILAITRRGKYLLLNCETGWLLLHLGMSGRLRVVPSHTPAGKHDHVDILLLNGTAIRFTDARRFGTMLWAGTIPEAHPLLADLGLEPLTDTLSGQWLLAATRGAKIAIKSWLMDSKRITGVGNIYANEALFRAGIRPTCPAGRISLSRLERLAVAIRETLCRAIDAGGSTLRDFTDANGKPGYFQQEYFVYGRAAKHCLVCGKTIKVIRQGGRATYYCSNCQH